MRTKLALSISGVLTVSLWVVLIGAQGVVADSSDAPASLFAESSRLASEAVSRLGDGTCGQTAGCDPVTGCLAPGTSSAEPPSDNAFGEPYDTRPRALQLFHACRAIVLNQSKIRNSDPRLFSFRASSSSDGQFAADVVALNGDIFWAPATKSSAIITQFGDEARAVFGPIPDIDCTDAAKTTHVEVDGNLVDLKRNTSKPGSPLEFEHRDTSGNIVKWTATIPQCDKPTLAGGWKDTYCGLNNRMNRVVRGNIEWVAFCRKTGGAEVSADPFWLASTPTFSLLGMYGFNQSTGESVFFDGREDGSTFDWSQPFAPPGGKSYSDDQGRTAAEGNYDPSFQVQCSKCHDNKNLHVVDTDIGLARVGYRDTAIRDAFSFGDYLPQFTRSDDAPFRVIGTAYTATYAAELSAAQTVRDPTGNCRGCHTLTTQLTGRRFAADAVAKQPFLSGGTADQRDMLTREIQAFKLDAAHRTSWALTSGLGKIHPWMVPHDGNDLSGTPDQLSDPDWQKLSNCLWGNGGTECGYKPLYTKCPVPGSKSDAAAPTALAAAMIDAPSGSRQKSVRLTWRYLNSLGGVLERDDVRFNVTIKEVDIPSNGQPPVAGDFPPMSEAQGQNWTPITSDIGHVGADWLLQNASYAGHIRWTDPTASTTPRDYRVDIPAACGKRYLLRISPKRFCFDTSGQLFGSDDYTASVDVVCK